MISINPPFFHDLFKVAIRNALPDIKENRIKNNVFGVGVDKTKGIPTRHPVI
jgi:hypothetical protein